MFIAWSSYFERWLVTILLSCALGCGTKGGSHYSSSTPSDAGTSRPSDEGTATRPDAGLEASVVSSGPQDAGHHPPLADGAECNDSRGDPIGVVCFGADQTAYSQWLNGCDGGWPAGECPKVSDFTNKGFCGGGGVAACGPLLAGYAEDHGYVPDAGDPNCCFLVSNLLFCLPP